MTVIKNTTTINDDKNREKEACFYVVGENENLESHYGKQLFHNKLKVTTPCDLVILLLLSQHEIKSYIRRYLHFDSYWLCTSQETKLTKFSFKGLMDN